MNFDKKRYIDILFCCMLLTVLVLSGCKSAESNLDKAGKNRLEPCAATKESAGSGKCNPYSASYN